MNTAGDKLRALRVERGWSQDKLALLSGVTQSTLSRIEDGRCWPTDRTKVRIAKAFDIDPLSLFPFTEE